MWRGPPSWIWAHVDGAAGSQSVARACCDFFAGEGVRRLRLRRTADVESTDVGQGNDAAVLGWLDGARLRHILLEREVGARAVVVAEVAAQTRSKVCLVQDDEVVEKLAADGAAHSLGERVLPGRMWCHEHLGDVHASHPSPRLAVVDVVANLQEVTRRRVIGKRRLAAPSRRRW